MAETSATRGAEVGRGHCEVMEGQDLWERAGVASGGGKTDSMG